MTGAATPPPEASLYGRVVSGASTWGSPERTLVGMVVTAASEVPFDERCAGRVMSADALETALERLRYPLYLSLMDPAAPPGAGSGGAADDDNDPPTAYDDNDADSGRDFDVTAATMGEEGGVELGVLADKRNTAPVEWGGGDDEGGDDAADSSAASAAAAAATRARRAA